MKSSHLCNIQTCKNVPMLM